MRSFLIAFCLLFFRPLNPVCSQDPVSQSHTDNIILVTLDGMRWQEVFRGADKKLLHVKKHKYAKNKTIDQFWDKSTEARRNKLMPFLWSEVASKGVIYGNRDKGCRVRVANQFWFSYPGYHEILSGNTDIRINSNSMGPNPRITVLEKVNFLPEYRKKVAVFSSWPAFADIINENRSGIYVNNVFRKIPEQLASPVQV
jgi:hypothetical protein